MRIPTTLFDFHASSNDPALVERPAEKWPDIFARLPLFVHYPYLLPTSIAAVITGIGAVLTLFLARDGGPREGAIRLPPEKDDVRPPSRESSFAPPMEDEEEPTGMVNKLKRKVSIKLSGYFARRVHEAHDAGSPLATGAGSSPITMPLSRRTSSGNKVRSHSRTSRANGSAYGYGTSYRNRLASTTSFAGRRGSLASTIARRRESIAHGQSGGANTDVSASQADGVGDMNFAQRLLMANELAVNNIADLWVAAAMNVDNEDVFLSDSEAEDHGAEPNEYPFGDDEDEELLMQTPSRPGRLSTARALGSANRQSLSTPNRPSTSGSHPHLGSPRSPPGHSPFANVGGSSSLTRRFSSTFPTIFSHTGVRTPPAAHEPHVHSLVSHEGHAEAEAGASEGLEPIFESRPVTSYAPKQTSEPRVTVADESLETVSEKQPSMLSQLPLAIIMQYGMLALHSTTHDQVFLSYLVS